jgi:pimeloyl-ACP methyl ester carboxylesterase
MQSKASLRDWWIIILRIDNCVVMNGSVKLAVDVVGEGTPILLLHGIPDARKMWRELTPFFVDEGYQVIAPDMRGFGDSPLLTKTSDYKVKLVLEDLIQLFDDHEIVQPIHVLGHDWGAVIAWCMALSYPDRVKSLVPVSVGHPMSYARAGLLQKWKGRYVLGFQLRGFAEHWMSTDDFASLRC